MVQIAASVKYISCCTQDIPSRLQLFRLCEKRRNTTLRRRYTSTKMNPLDMHRMPGSWRESTVQGPPTSMVDRLEEEEEEENNMVFFLSLIMIIALASQELDDCRPLVPYIDSSPTANDSATPSASIEDRAARRNDNNTHSSSRPHPPPLGFLEITWLVRNGLEAFIREPRLYELACLINQGRLAFLSELSENDSQEDIEASVRSDEDTHVPRAGPETILMLITQDRHEEESHVPNRLPVPSSTEVATSRNLGAEKEKFFDDTIKGEWQDLNTGGNKGKLGRLGFRGLKDIFKRRYENKTYKSGTSGAHGVVFQRKR
ncbi:hypothetical protein F5Y16DRAFT_382207 [Xylariaceae sp. FL0255]|nr:hypothetical protein F5Y16DRAFT_382207 [Xylariaceae sp. FL0255]